VQRQLEKRDRDSQDRYDRDRDDRYRNLEKRKRSDGRDQNRERDCPLREIINTIVGGFSGGGSSSTSGKDTLEW